MYETILNYMQVVGGLLISAGYIPQIIKTNRIKKVDNFSPSYYLMIWLGVGMCFLYGIDVAIKQGDLGLMLGQGFSLSVVTAMIVSYFLYRKGDKAKSPNAVKWQKYYEGKQ